MNLEEAWDILQKNSFKRTKNRELILEYFMAHDRYITALEVRNELVKDNPGLSYDTIYRNLATFAELSILEETELNGERHFRMQCDVASHHHHFICTNCGKTEHIPFCPMEMMEVTLPNHQIVDHKFEIYGMCPNCL